MMHENNPLVLLTVLCLMGVSLRVDSHVCDSDSWACLHDYSGHGYMVYIYPMYVYYDMWSYSEAVDLCDNQEMHVVYVETEEETYTLSDLLQEAGFSNVPYWLGMRKRKDGWYWGKMTEEGSPVTRFYWANRPNPTDGYDVAIAWSRGLWHKADWDDTNVVICEEWDMTYGHESITTRSPPFSEVTKYTWVEGSGDFGTTATTPSELDPGAKLSSREVPAIADHDKKDNPDLKTLTNGPCPVGFCFQREMANVYYTFASAEKLSLLECAILCSKTTPCQAIAMEGASCIILSIDYQHERPMVDCGNKVCYEVSSRKALS